MKSILLTVMLPLVGLISQVNAQIPNAGFESWNSGEPDNWVTDNASPYIAVTQSSNVYSGISAARGEVITVGPTLVSPFIQGGTAGTGIPIAARYATTQLYYEFAPVSGDRFSLNVVFYKNGNPIAVGAVAAPASVSSYTLISVTMNYSTIDIPDTAIIQISINGPTGNDYHLGSVMYVDEVSFTAPLGMHDDLAPFSIGESYPNPCHDFMEIPIRSTNSVPIQVKIYDSQGRQVKNAASNYFTSGESNLRISTSDLEDGLYFYTITSSDFSLTREFSVAN